MRVGIGPDSGKRFGKAWMVNIGEVRRENPRLNPGVAAAGFILVLTVIGQPGFSEKDLPDEDRPS